MVGLIMEYKYSEMELTKAETNNAIIVELANVREHPNADRLKLATVLGTTVVVGLDAKNGDIVIYFDSNLRLGHEYLHHNNLYSDAGMNSDISKKGYFGKNGRVRAQKFRGELSNGYVADLMSLEFAYDGLMPLATWCEVGIEFTHINGVEICTKFLLPVKHNKQGTGKPGKPKVRVANFHRHWDTKQLMREMYKFKGPAMFYIEEKVHGTSGRIGHVRRTLHSPWWKFWAPKEDWKVMGGTRRTDHTHGSFAAARQEVERKVAPHLYKGEQIYFEIYGYSANGGWIQKGFPYDCRPGENKVILYRVTITTPDGFVVDLDREQVYRRADELGLNRPHLFKKGWMWPEEMETEVYKYYTGLSALDAGTMREGVVIWFQTEKGIWKCLKHKSEEFLIKESGNRDKGIGDVEDEL